MKTVIRKIDTNNNVDISKLNIPHHGSVLIQVDTTYESKTIYMPSARDTSSIMFRIVNIGSPSQRMWIFPKKGTNDLLSNEDVLYYDNNGDLITLSSDGISKYW